VALDLDLDAHRQPRRRGRRVRHADVGADRLLTRVEVRAHGLHACPLDQAYHVRGREHRGHRAEQLRLGIDVTHRLVARHLVAELVSQPGLVRWTLGDDPGAVAARELPEAEMKAWSEHLAAFLGPSSTVLHELVSDAVHLDVLRFSPAPGRPFHVLVTQGMSARPMNVPEEATGFEHAELLLAVPEDWKLDGPESADPRWHWPVQTLKLVARLPHLYDTWIGCGHTIPNGDPPEPYAANTVLCCALVAFPTIVPEPAWRCEVAPGKVVHLYALFAICEDEMELKLKRDAEALLDKMEKQGVTEVIDPSRKSALARKWRLF